MENPVVVTLHSQEIEETIDLLLEQIQEEERNHLLLGGFKDRKRRRFDKRGDRRKKE